MIKRLGIDQSKAKIVRRYIVAVYEILVLLGEPELSDAFFEPGAGRSLKGLIARQFRTNRAVVLEMIEAAKKAEISLPSSKECANLLVCLKETRKDHKAQVDVESKVVESVEHKGFTVEVHELTGTETRARFMPLILKDGKVVRRIFVRSQSAYVSLEHFGKRAVDHFVAMGYWPRKQGVTVGK